VKTQAILFDFGGTLDSDGIHWSEQFFIAYQRLGSAVSRDRFDQAFLEADRIIASSYNVRGYTLRELLELQVSLQFENLRFEDEGTKRAIAAACYESVKRMLERNRNLLSRLHEGFKLGVISNFNGNLEVVCAEFGLDPYLDLILDSGNLPVSKPDPRIFELALEQLQLNASDCYYVGDNFERDILPAKKVGFNTIWLRPPDGRACPDPSQVDHIISSLTDIEHIFLKEERR
jgi:FMN phosphatase YigB (HAD superfamily)